MSAEWTRTVDDPDRLRWERADGLATVRCRERVDGRWAVTYDRLEQAPATGDEAYRHEVVEDRAAAEELAATWRD